MIYIIAILLPPLATMMEGLFFATLFNLALTAFGIVTLGLGYPLASIHACVVVAGARTKKRHEEMLAALKSNQPN